MNSHQIGADAADCYVDEIPSFAGPELIRLYGTLHSSLPFFELFRSTERASCYVARRAGKISCIFVFVIRGKRLEVLNEMIEVGADEIERFACHVFACFADIDIIRFRALDTQLAGFGFPYQKYRAKQTYCVTLPQTPEEYVASLGDSTRAGIRRKINKINKAFPSWYMEYHGADTIDERDLREVMRLSEATINARKVIVRYDVARILAMARQCGFVGLLRIDGRICAGSIGYRIGANYFNEVVGYDKQYEKYGIGTVATYQTIRESIAGGGRRFYFGGGHFDYKRRLGGRIVSMDELRIYRSRRKVMAHLGQAGGAVFTAGWLQCKDFLHRHHHHALARLVYDAYYLLKNRSVG